MIMVDSDTFENVSNNESRFQSLNNSDMLNKLEAVTSQAKRKKCNGQWTCFTDGIRRNWSQIF